MKNLAVLVAYSLRMGEGGEGGEGGNDDGDNDGGGNNNSIDTNSQAFKDAVSTAAKQLSDQSEAGLKNKNSELLKKLEKANGRADAFGGSDPEKVKTIMKIFEQNEEAQLIAEGKFEEVMKKRTDAVEAGFHDQLTEYKNRAETAEGTSGKYKTQLDQNTIRAEITSAALKAGVMGDAIEDVVQRAFSEFSVNESGEVESRDANGNLRQNKDDLLINPERFVDALKETNAYYWPSSNGGGTGGSDDQQGGLNADAAVQNAAQTKNGKLDLAAYRKKREQQGGENYHQRSNNR